MEPLTESQRGWERRAAWTDFYARFGVNAGPDGGFEVKPLANEALTFQIRSKNRPTVRFGTFKRSTGSVLDIGDLRVPHGSRLRIILAHESEEIPKDETFNVEARLARPDPGTDVTADAITGILRSKAPLTLGNLVPGEWTLKLLLRGVLLGQENVTLLSEDQTFSWMLTDETIAGLVLNMSGDPIEGAKVTAQYPPRAQTLSGVDGRFSIRFAHAGGDVVVQAGLSGPTLPQMKTVDPRSGEAQLLEFHLPQNEIVVRIRDAANKLPIAGSAVNIDIFPEGTTHVARMRVSASAEGDAQVRGLPSARIEMTTVAPGYSDDGPRSFTLSESHQRESQEVQLKKADRVAGLVVDNNGTPIPGAHVCGPVLGSPDAPCHDVTAGVDGKFELEVPPDRPSMLASWAVGFRLGFVNAIPGQTDTTILLMQPGVDADITLEKPGGDTFQRGVWTLVVDGLALEQNTLIKAFLSNACRLPTVIGSALHFGRCVMPGRYSLLVTDLSEPAREKYVSEQFDSREGIPLRLRSAPLKAATR